MGKIASWYRRRQQRGSRPLAPIELAIGAMLLLASAIAVAVTVIGLRLLHFRGFKPEPLLSAVTLYDLFKVAFAIAAGIGGVVALVTAYRRQRVAEFAQDLALQQHELSGRTEDRAALDSKQEHGLAATRLLNERFATAAGLLGDDEPAVRLAGVYAMAGLADDWTQQRQTCVDVLCAYLRMPYGPEPRDNEPSVARQAFRAAREVRHTVIRVIAAHLQPDGRQAAAVQDWRGLEFDFTGAEFDGGQFTGAEFTGGLVSFDRAEFSGGTVFFDRTRFAGGTVSFEHAHFTGGTVFLDNAEFIGARVSFDGAQVSGGLVSFDHARFTGGTVFFNNARVSGGMVSFNGARFAGALVSFDRAGFTGGFVSFARAEFSSGLVSFDYSEFTGGQVDFSTARSTVPPRLPVWIRPPAGLFPPAPSDP